MPKATFSDFIKQSPNCKKFEDDADMLTVFDLLSKDDSIFLMVDTSEAGKPALAPLAVEIESIFSDAGKTHANTLDDNFTKQAVGLMIKAILDPFGYSVVKQKGLPKGIDAKKFRSASVYEYDDTKPKTMQVVRRVEEIL